MAEFLEDFDFNQQITNKSQSTLQLTLQMIDLAEKEGFEHLEISDVKLIDGILFNRLLRLDKVQKIKIVNTNITTLANIPPNVLNIFVKKGDIQIVNFKLVPTNVKKVEIINNRINRILFLDELINLTYLDLSQNNLESIPQLSKNLKTFIATHNKIKKISNLNKNLMELNLSNNLIEQVCNVPPDLELLNISRNLIRIVDLSYFTKLKIFKAYK
jgi:Leucine-rich repeat (LRR) protein